MAEKKEEGMRMADLPLISELPKSDMQQARKWLEELEDLKPVKEAVKEREDAANAGLRELQFKHELAGLRFGNLAFTAKLMDGRETLDADAYNEMLMEKYGVPVKAIEACKKVCTKQGKAYTMHIFKDLSLNQKLP